MGVSSATRKRVFLAFKGIFVGPEAKLRDRRKVRGVARKHRTMRKYRVGLESLLQEVTECEAVDTLMELLEDGSFESGHLAGRSSPDLSDSTASGNRPATPEVTTSATTKISETVPPRSPPPAMPTVHPMYLPYKSQHALLTTAQQILEECCFEFAKAWLPDVVKAYGWDCAAAVELTRWDRFVCSKLRELPPEAPSLAESTFKTMIWDVRNLRNTAVHRDPTPARDLGLLLRPAVRLASALKDDRRASQLERLRSEVNRHADNIEHHNNYVQRHTQPRLEAIKRAKDDLDKEEKDLAANMAKSSQNFKALVGQLLEKEVDIVLVQETVTAEPEGSPSTDGQGVEEQQNNVEELMDIVNAGFDQESSGDREMDGGHSPDDDLELGDGQEPSYEE